MRFVWSCLLSYQTLEKCQTKTAVSARERHSKLLIAQVLGRGLRVPEGWQGEQPEVTVFNHDAWAPRIRHLVDEILEIEKRISSRIIEDSPYHFELHNIKYDLKPT